MEEKQKKRILTLLLLVSVLLFSWVGWKVGLPLIRFARDPQRFRIWVREQGVWAPAIMIGMVVFQVVFALLPGEPFEIAAGYAFGGLYGGFLCLVGTTLGGTAVFFLVQKWGTRVLELYFTPEKIRSLRFLQDTHRTRSIAFLLMMIPGTPKDILCYGMGLTKIRLGEWIVISMIARIPSVLTSTFGGGALGEKNYALAALVFGVSLALGLIGLWLFRFFSSGKGEGEGAAG